jgi:predicted anti-sigma-YlaC factor YlaD
MTSSTPRSNKLVELVTKAIITLSSTPDSASLTTSATGPVSLILVGRGFSVEIGLTAAVASAASSACSAMLTSSLADAVASPVAFPSGSRAVDPRLAA